MRNIAIVGSIALAALAFALPVAAQTVEDVVSYETSVNEGDFEFEISPRNPGPFQDVTVRVTSNLVDANRYPITWTVNDGIVSQGIGKRSITVRTGSYGQTTIVRMSIRLVDSVVQKEVVLTPQDSTILWEAIDSYVPPFYQGKKLPARESFVKITSIPNFLSDRTSSGTKDAVYNWRRNGKVVADGSGYGKDSLVIQHNRVRATEQIEVTSSSVNGSAQAISGTTLSFYDPRVMFYDYDPASELRSPFARTSVTVRGESLNLEAVPYFFSVVNGNPDSLNYSWTMNNRTLSLGNTRRKNFVTLRNPGENGSSSIGLEVRNGTKLFQSAKGILNASFQQP